ncbi:ABC transporter substrate-binding protein [Actinocrinis puniceicyclus]|uniref:ABC transporter substrate-binding protein n=1 Tax=Actinocrinis puniceicyclus TaxID=977794 RepID=A0A8J8BC97_9ACTN|nr:ABC transporter substrate-binding protein [Actinocrinis puniceicyclus]MBS2963310.1 ABC transporter substrate-binding protein [Actinocrinis puniceicyclus]
MQRTTKIAATAAAAALVASVASACGSSSGGASGSDTIKFNYGVTGLVNPSTKQGGTLVLGGSQDLDAVDPVNQYYAYSWDFSRYYARTVLQYKVGDPKQVNTLVPGLAASMPTPSSDGLTWTVKLRPGLKFSNGEPITSKNVKYAVERSYAVDTVNPAGPEYFSGLLTDPKYPGPYKDTASDHLGLKGIDTPDDTTLIFHLQSKYADFPYLMTLAQTAPVPIDVDQNSATGGKNYTGTNVVSSGPYKISAYTAGKDIELVRNPNWDRSTDPNDPALPDKISVKTDWDPTQLDQAVLAGTVAYDYTGAGLQPADIGPAQNIAAKKKLTDNPAANTTRYVSIDQDVAPFDNIHCRKAVAYAMNKVDLVAARGGTVAGAKVTGTMLPPGVPGYANVNPYPAGPDNKGDLAKAKEELTACGHPNGFSTGIITVNTGKGPGFATALQNALTRVGITTQITQVEGSKYYSQNLDRPDVMKSKGYGLAAAGWGPDFPTAFGFFSQITDGSVLTATSSGSNYGRLNDPMVNSLLGQMKAASSTQEEASLGTKLDAQVMSDAVYIPYGNDTLLLARSPKVTNYYIDSALNSLPDDAAVGVQQ